MKTTMKALRFGIEIETVGLRREQLARAIHSVVGGTIAPDYDRTIWYVTDPSGHRWKVEPDGSLGDPTNSGEIVSPVLGHEDLDVLQRIVRAVQAAGGRSDWRDERAGLAAGGRGWAASRHGGGGHGGGCAPAGGSACG